VLDFKVGNAEAAELDGFEMQGLAIKVLYIIS
jgi:hypothetical protein